MLSNDMDSSTIECTAVQWYSTQSLVAHQGLWGHKALYLPWEPQGSFTYYTPPGSVFLLPCSTLIYSPRHLPVCKGILPYSLLETYSSSSLCSILNLLLLITGYAALLLNESDIHITICRSFMYNLVKSVSSCTIPSLAYGESLCLSASVQFFMSPLVKTVCLSRLTCPIPTYCYC